MLIQAMKNHKKNTHMPVITQMTITNTISMILITIIYEQIIKLQQLSQVIKKKNSILMNKYQIKMRHLNHIFIKMTPIIIISSKISKAFIFTKSNPFNRKIPKNRPNLTSKQIRNRA